MINRVALHLALFFLIALALGSCAGVSADIVINANGSGNITLEYRVSPLAESLGKLDGNERWQTVPAGRADFERTIARLPGMRLRSFSSKTEPGSGGKTGDVINRVEMEFDKIESLLPFLDASGRNAVFSSDGGAKRLKLAVLEKQAAPVDPDLLALLREVSKGYRFGVSFSAPGDSSLSLANGEGAALSAGPGISLVPRGKKVSFSIDAGELFGLVDGLEAEIRW